MQTHDSQLDIRAVQDAARISLDKSKRALSEQRNMYPAQGETSIPE